MSSVGVQPGRQVASRRPASRPASRLFPYACAFLLIVLTLALYYPAKSHPFVNYDDDVYVTGNLHVQSGLTTDTVNWALTTFDGGNWHPLTWISHALDYQLFQDKPAGHHETSLLLHAINAALLFWVLWRATGYLGRSFMVAAVFAVHPINVESVVWIAERKTVLSMMFFLLALGAYRWYVSKPKVARYAVVAAMFALGLMAKPQIITFPFVLLLWDYWPLGRLADRHALFANGRSMPTKLSGDKLTAKSERRTAANRVGRLFAEKLPLFAIAAVSAAITMKAQAASGAVLSLKSIPFSMRLSNAIVSYVKYIEKAVWPAKLAPFYPHPGPWLPSWMIYSSLLVLIAATVVVFEHRDRGYLPVGWLWFLGTMVPMIGLVQVGRQAMADRYAYLPLVGIFIMICWGLAECWQQTHLPTAALAAVSVFSLLALGAVAHRQIGYWADNALLWRHTIAVTAPNYVAEDNLGSVLMPRDRAAEAMVHYRRAAALHPTDPVAFFSIAMYEQERGQLAQAIDDYRRAITLTTSTQMKVKAFENMGIAYRDLGNPEQSRECFAESRKLQGL